MIACVDVGYDDPRATAACVLFAAWSDAAPQAELSVAIAEVAPYQPGEFFRRELPCLERVLDQVRAPLEAIVIDGFVWLARDRAGLGAHLYAARGGGCAVIGVAKNAYRGNDVAVPVVRGAGKKPLYITAAGIDVGVAAAHLRAMHGEHRIPTLLAAVDRLSRGRAQAL